MRQRISKSRTPSRRSRRFHSGPTKRSSGAARRRASPDRLSTGAPVRPTAARRCRDHLRRVTDHVLTGAAHETFLSVGDVTFRVASDDPRLASAPDGPLESFCAGHGRADVDIRARWTDPPAACRGDVLFDSGAPWPLLPSNGEFLFTFRSSTAGPVPYKIARFNP